MERPNPRNYQTEAPPGRQDGPRTAQERKASRITERIEAQERKHRELPSGLIPKAQNIKNYRADLPGPTDADPTPNPLALEPCAFGSAKRYACPHFDNQGSGTPLLEASPHAFGFV